MTLQGDTLVCNKERLLEYQSNSAYDYNHGLLTPEFNFFEWLDHWLERFFEAIFGSHFAATYTKPILIGLFIAAILLIIWFIYKKRPELFMRSPKKIFAYDVSEDTIYGVDFSAEIAGALAAGHYKEAIRLLYLQTLKELSDQEAIDWQPYKTPSEYIYEIKSGAKRESFRELTRHFLRVRYGNFDASEALFTTMKTCQTAIREGGEDER